MVHFSQSPRGYEYFSTFIYEFSRKTWICFLKTRDEVFNHFQEFNALVENSTGKKIKVLQIDNGGKYIEKSFKDFCTKEGIESEQLCKICSRMGLQKEITKQ